MSLFKGTGLLKLGCLGLLLAVLGMGCAKSGSSDSIKLSSWGDPKENAILADLIADFQKNHPDIKVELQRVPWGEYKTKLMTSVSAGIAPDVIFVSTDDVATFANKEVLEPLDEYIKNDKFSMDDFFPTAREMYSINGHQYALPRDLSPLGIVYYNKKAFDAAHLSYPTDDWNWKELLADAKALTKVDASGKTTQWGYAEDWPMVEAWAFSAGGRWVDNPMNPNQYAFNTQAFIDGLQFRTDLILKYKVCPGPSNMTAMGGLGASDLFTNGSTAMLMAGMWKIPAFRDIKEFDWDIAMFPKGPTGQRGFLNGSSGYGILKASKNKQKAWELVKYLSGPAGDKKLASTGLAQPALKSVSDSGAFLDGQKPTNKKMLNSAQAYAIFAPRAANWSEVMSGSIIPVLDQIWTGKITPAEAVAKIAENLKDKPLVIK